MNKIIVNLTQHKATAEQVEGGVFDMDEKHAAELREILIFDRLPSKDEIIQRGEEIASLAIHEGAGRCTCGICEICEDNDGYPHGAMIGGAPYLMGALERALIKRGITPLYAFSLRVSEEKEIEGKVIKTQVFKHLDFVEVV